MLTVQDLCSEVLKLNVSKEYIALYIPSTIGDIPTDNKYVTDYISKSMIDIFGGVTIHPGRGGWRDNDGRYILEEVSIAKSFTQNLSRDTIEKVVLLAKYIKEEMKQCSVALELNGQMAFI